MANGVADILPLQPFPIRVLNTSHRERKLTKKMVLGHALPHPTGIVALVDEDFLETPDQPAMLLSPENSESPLPDRPDAEGELWKEDVNPTHMLPHGRESVLKLLAKHRMM
jgi:hypothetical protein